MCLACQSALEHFTVMYSALSLFFQYICCNFLSLQSQYTFLFIFISVFLCVSKLNEYLSIGFNKIQLLPISFSNMSVS